MTANPSLIDAMARALWLEDARRTAAERRAMGRIPDDGEDIDPAWYDQDAAMPVTGPGFRAKWEGQARAALRSLRDHGPTQRMLDEVCSDDAAALIAANDETMRAVFREMIAAELAEADNHG